MKVNLGPKPTTWDLAAIGLAGLAIVAMGANLALSKGGSPSTGLTLVMALAQMGIMIGSLLVLGKTAKQGTIWGNLASVGGLMLGLSGILLAAALWTAA